MLDGDEIDDDYFTPAPSTSLANIFSDLSHKSRNPENESLKYTPPKKQDPQSQNVESKQEEESKVICIYACALTAYEWIDSKYSLRGKLGFAILNITKTNSYNIVLYNSNKTTLSNTKISTKLKLTLKGNDYISYYDNQNKYWSIYGKKEEISKIIEIFKSLEVDVKLATNTDQNPPEPNKTDTENSNTVTHDKESDTDSSVSRKTKASILNRMAHMGHSVLPPGPCNEFNDSSDSDSNKFTNLPTKLKSKPSKLSVRRISIEKKGSECNVTDNFNMPLAKFDQPTSTMQSLNPALFAMVNGQLVPVTNTNNIMHACGGSASNEQNLFMTEQRMNNNELRVNINRTTDKVDQVLEKLKHFEKPSQSNGDHFQMEIMRKLLKEYEYKIKKYEQLLTSNKALPEDSTEIVAQTGHDSSKEQISKQTTVHEKDKEIIKLNEHLLELLKEHNHLKENLSSNVLELEKMSKELDEIRIRNNANKGQNFENKLKDMMNHIYHSISINFESGNTYSGENVNKIIASIIKKATIDLLSEYNSEN